MKKIYLVFALFMGSLFAYAGDASIPLLSTDEQEVKLEDDFADVADVALNFADRVWQVRFGSDQEKLEIYKADRKKYLKQSKMQAAEQALENMQLLREVMRCKQAYDETKLAGYKNFLQECEQLKALEYDGVWDDIQLQKRRMRAYAKEQGLLPSNADDMNDDIARVKKEAQEYATRVKSIQQQIKVLYAGIK